MHYPVCINTINHIQGCKQKLAHIATYGEQLLKMYSYWVICFLTCSLPRWELEFRSVVNFFYSSEIPKPLIPSHFYYQQIHSLNQRHHSLHKNSLSDSSNYYSTSVHFRYVLQNPAIHWVFSMVLVEHEIW